MNILISDELFQDAAFCQSQFQPIMRRAVLDFVMKIDEEMLLSPIYENKSLSAKGLAILFHETYERLAPSFGYETRQETKEFNEDSNNGRLMIAVCDEILSVIRAEMLQNE